MKGIEIVKVVINLTNSTVRVQDIWREMQSPLLLYKGF